MKKIVAINSTFRTELFYTRWRDLVKENPNFEVTLIGPSKFEYSLLGENLVWTPEPITEDRFKVRHISWPTNKYVRFLNGMLSLKLIKLLLQEKPDLIYMIGYESDNLVIEVGVLRKLFFPKTKILGFTMRGLDMPLEVKSYRWGWNITSKIYDAICCHYPHAIDVLRNQGGYEGPLYMQTQIGVNKKVFYPNAQMRMQRRRELGITDEFVFGSASRIDKEKGITDILEGLPKSGNWKYIMLGGGVHEKEIQTQIKEMGLEDNVIVTGLVDPGEGVASYLNAMDCFIHVPRTTPTWIDTFPLAVVQAMATGLPVIGSDSGAVPYQLGPDGIVVPERNPEALGVEIFNMLNHPDMAKEIGQKMFDRVMNAFEIQHLNKCLLVIFNEVLNGEFDEKHQDQSNFKFE